MNHRADTLTFPLIFNLAETTEIMDTGKLQPQQDECKKSNRSWHSRTYIIASLPQPHRNYGNYGRRTQENAQARPVPGGTTARQMLRMRQTK